MEEDIVRSREAGFTAHMTKPIDFAKLEAMIRQIVSYGTIEEQVHVPIEPAWTSMQEWGQEQELKHH